MSIPVYINKISTSIPDNEVHSIFMQNLEYLIEEEKLIRKMRKIEPYCSVNKRYSVLSNPISKNSEDDGFYGFNRWPDTADRMSLYQKNALTLASLAISDLLELSERSEITHLVVTSCTGFYAPGLDLEIVRYLELNPKVERTVIGFMGCYAAINGLKYANHIVRSTPQSKVLMVNLELCSLHLQHPNTLEDSIPYLLFADGCAASIISAQKIGIKMNNFYSTYISEGWNDMSWKIGRDGFLMNLSSRIPDILANNLNKALDEMKINKDSVELAVHPGGEKILQAVERVMNWELNSQELLVSREVLRSVGNLSSATIMFVLKSLLAKPFNADCGTALAFGPGLSMECMKYERV